MITSEQIENLDKLYYSIGEVAKMFNVNTSLIRYWEKEFPIIRPKKNQKGNRQFTKKDIENIHKIHYLVKDRGMTLDGAKSYLKNNNGVSNFELIKTLQGIRAMVVNLKETLENPKDIAKI
ncbi:MAG: MerR family transcriptional regulator [Bacteroidales bacterium]|nr:MerR family transcriptional regulator [Bacteroidales bacterium]